jgi:protein-S-isoprenylcysteine O-methyltransferase Ste14
MGWLGILMSVGIGAAVLLPAVHTGRPLPGEMYAVLALLLFFPVSLFVFARGIFARRDWARWAGIVYGAVALLGIPIGTLIGAYVLWQLQKGWPE